MSMYEVIRWIISCFLLQPGLCGVYDHGDSGEGRCQEEGVGTDLARYVRSSAGEAGRGDL